MNRPRKRWMFGAMLLVVIVLGLASRKFAAALPKFVAEYAGDTLWALAAYVGFATLFARARIAGIASGSLVFAYAIETSQLYHAPWIDSIRATTLGGLILGFGFLWSDLVCYTVGVLLGALIDGVLRRAGRRDG